MANKDFPGGMVPVRNESGTAPKLEAFTAADSIEIGMYAPLVLDGDGKVALATHALLEDGKGIGVSAQYLSSTATDREILVYSDPDQEYEMQSDDATLTGAGAAIGRLFRITNITSVNSTTLQCTAEIDGDTGASVTGGTGDGTDVTPIRIERVSTAINNSPYTLNGRFIVRFCAFVMLRSNAGVGGVVDQLQIGL
jgi:hypothetical protein